MELVSHLGNMMHEGVCETFYRTQQIVNELTLKFPASWKCLLETMGR